MKRIGFIFLIFMVFHHSVLGVSIKLNDAFNNKKIVGEIRGNSASTHYLEPIILDLTNSSNEFVNITIDNGDLFIPIDDTKQKIIVTSPQIITLQPKQRSILKIKGMCIQRNNAAGNNDTKYIFKTGDNEKLKNIAVFINEKKYQSTAAQQAVWCLVDNVDFNTIIAADSSEENNLKRFMAKLTGKTYAVQAKDYTTSYYAPPREKVGGMFEYTIPIDKDVQIAMFNKDGILVRELFNQKKVVAGTHKINFEYDSSVYTDDVYYFKLIVNNNIFLSQKWDAGAMREKFKKNMQKRINEN